VTIESFARYRVHTSGGLVKKQNRRVPEHGDDCLQFSFVAAAEVLGFSVLERVQTQHLVVQLFLHAQELVAQTFDLTHDVVVLFDCKGVP